MVLRCVVYDCSNKKDEKKGIHIHQIPFYGDTRSEAVKRRRKWISFVNGSRLKTLDPKQVFGGVLDASQRFHSHVFFQPTVLSGATEAC